MSTRRIRSDPDGGLPFLAGNGSPCAVGKSHRQARQGAAGPTPATAPGVSQFRQELPVSAPFWMLLFTACKSQTAGPCRHLQDFSRRGVGPVDRVVFGAQAGVLRLG